MYVCVVSMNGNTVCVCVCVFDALRNYYCRFFARSRDVVAIVTMRTLEVKRNDVCSRLFIVRYLLVN